MHTNIHTNTHRYIYMKNILIDNLVRRLSYSFATKTNLLYKEKFTRNMCTDMNF